MGRYFIIFLMGLSTVSFSQIIRGKVTDIQKRAIEGVHILSVKSGRHAHTDYGGRFILSDIRPGDSLLVTHIGYVPVYQVIDNTTNERIIRLEEKVVALDEILVTPELDAINLFAEVDIMTNAVNSSQELLRRVPGLVIGQHAGGGKAEQIFLRGFDIDHGTDINITVDGMPVNMVSHAHGQGYADLHFLIPETIEHLNFGKGPYYADQGNFTTAGFVAFETKEKIDNSLVKLEAGQFNTSRLLGMFNILSGENHAAYIASEYLLTDGPFESPQNFDRLNLLGKYTGHLANQDKVAVQVSHFSSKWDASGQIPQRAVDDGSISRFGAIDDTEGGETSRTNVLLDYTRKVNTHSFVKNTVYYSQYDFELYSNFTFFLNDPVYGDQIRQREHRSIMGMKSEYNHSFHRTKSEGLVQLGAGLRSDRTDDTELSHTRNRRVTLDSLQLGDIHETNFFTYLNGSFRVGKWLFNPSVRTDYFKFSYQDHLSPVYQTQAESKAVISPKLNVLYNYSGNLQLYVKGGKGFHSNDARVVVAQEGRQILPAALGADAGFIWKPLPKILINTAYWYLALDQEFVYVGDEGVVEPSGRTRRNGIDFSLRYQPLSWLYFDTDFNYTWARAMDEPEGNDYIPLAPDLTVMGGVRMLHPSGVYGGLRFRYVDDRPANEDNSIVAKGYTVIDLDAGYQWKNFTIGLNIQNLFDTEWNETQFATESRLSYEAEPVEEIHLTPGTPFFIKGSLSYKF